MTHTLPADPAAEVIRWQSTGGQAGGAPDPDLVVRADGTVTVGSRLAGGRAVAGRIPPDRLQDLLRFALDQQRFFAIAPAEVARRIEAGRQARPSAAGEAIAVPAGPPYPDAGTTVIAIAADGRRHEVSQHALFAAARDHPEIEALARLRAIEVRLLDLAREIAAAGG